MHMVPDDFRQAAVDHLVETIASRNWHLSTGFIGAPFLLSLTDDGYVAYRLLLTDTYPSWGYMLSKRTTTW
jgi:alpha-L-rhamnosidase